MDRTRRSLLSWVSLRSVSGFQSAGFQTQDQCQRRLLQLHRKRDGNARQLRSSHELADPVSPNAPDTTGQSEDIAAFADFQGNEVRQAIADARAGLAADPDLTIPQAARDGISASPRSFLMQVFDL